MSIESLADFEGMSRIGQAVAATLQAMSDYVQPGVSTAGSRLRWCASSQAAWGAVSTTDYL